MFTANSVGPLVSSVVATQPAAAATQRTKIETTDTATGHELSEHSQSSTPPDHFRDNFIDADRRLDEGVPILTGPPPAFEASLLELDADIENIIKRIHAEREKAHTGDAAKLGPSQASVSEVEQTANATAPDAQPATPYDAKPAPQHSDE